MSTLLIRILATLLAAIFSLFNISVDIPGFSDDNISTTTITYLNEKAGSMDAVITTTTTTDGTYKYYWADEDFAKLTFTLGEEEIQYSEFAEITTYFGEGSLDLPDYTAIPDNAAAILVTLNGETLEIFDIPYEKRADRGEEIYSFGSISDLHFNRYEIENKGDVADESFPRALTFFDKAGVTLVAMPGDISTDGEKEAFMSFNSIAAEYDFPVYTVTGNHDVREKFSKDNWREYMNAGVYSDTPDENIVNVSDNGLDFVYKEPVSGDIFIFLHQTSNNYGIVVNSLLTNDQLDWLEVQLDLYEDCTVNLFFHTFLSRASGNPFMSTGNLINELGWHYFLYYTIGSNDEARIRELLREYDNVNFFNGHSHWAYHLQSINPELNISKNGEDGATYIHVSSVSSPRITADYQVLWEGTDPTMSEGYLIKVYEDTMVLYGIDFVNNRILSYATYECEK